MSNCIFKNQILIKKIVDSLYFINNFNKLTI